MQSNEFRRTDNPSVRGERVLPAPIPLGPEMPEAPAVATQAATEPMVYKRHCTLFGQIL